MSSGQSDSEDSDDGIKKFVEAEPLSSCSDEEDSIEYSSAEEDLPRERSLKVGENHNASQHSTSDIELKERLGKALKKKLNNKTLY